MVKENVGKVLIVIGLLMVVISLGDIFLNRNANVAIMGNFLYVGASIEAIGTILKEKEHQFKRILVALVIVVFLALGLYYCL